MTSVLTGVGAGIEPVYDAIDMSEPVPETPVPAKPKPAKPKPFTMESIDMESLVAALRAELRGEMDAAVADAERRLAQAREIERSVLTGESRMVHTEDLNINRAMIDGYTLTANSPSAGYIAWANLHVVLAGVDWTIANGNTNKKYTYFIKPASGSTATLSTSDTMPTLGPNDAIIFVNNNGVGISVLESSVSYAVGSNVIGDDQVSSLSQGKISGLSTTLTGLNDAVTQAQATADGAITQTFGPTFPWPNGSPAPGPNPDARIGDVHTFQGATDQTNFPDGASYKWSGSAGSPANTWVLITDSAVSKALADAAAAKGIAQGKTTVYYRTTAQGAPPTPTEGFTTGDEWVTTDGAQDVKRWSGSAWTAVQFGDSALAGISGSKVGSGINGSYVTGGTVAAARIGAGVTGVSLTGVTGTLGNANLALNAVQPKNMNTPFHILY